MVYKSFLMILLALPIAFWGCSKETKVVDEKTLFEQATKAQIVKDYKKAVEIYQRIINDYPESPKLDKALFMIGFIKMEDLDEKEDALKYFNQLVRKYPDSDLVDDAEFMIEAILSGQDALTTFKNKASP